MACRCQLARSTLAPNFHFPTWGIGRAFLVACCFKEVKYHPVRVGGDTEAADAGNILGGAVNRATGCFDALCIDIDIIERRRSRPCQPQALIATCSPFALIPGSEGKTRSSCSKIRAPLQAQAQAS